MEIKKSLLLDRNLALEAVRVTEIAAIASSFHMGRGNEKAADQSAVATPVPATDSGWPGRDDPHQCRSAEPAAAANVQA